MIKITLSKFISSRYAISLLEAKEIVKENKIPVASEEVVFDFSNIDVVSTPFARTLIINYEKYDTKLENANDFIVEKWEQVRKETDKKFDISKALDELELTS